ncbi:alpha/beta-type small acid-soluble spore protein [Priestia megaterium]|uniref:alpha/beta-type small acid-soluble spore protein n=1 Tax=Priestia megaterium TaxID=1404 RepID=UPI000BEBE9CF|nr:alpha/beta-type small acid-soluble spore protein [Priestia megaterium]MBE2973087.1 alpha/beta-type small acid-soluble spore protein [Priestia megaterium]MED4064449.1 alpha/beta-type small acid-soluble spore protein [Priestia megaterium]PEA38488.1 small, acid-soluble spore protein, alpha/beta type [Priestia megaterium]
MVSRNQIDVPEAEPLLEQLKIEISEQFNVKLGANTTARENGSVGGEMTKRLVSIAQQQLSGTSI